MLKLLLSPSTLTPTKPVENFVITTKGLQDRNNLLLDGKTVENKGKLILTVCRMFLKLGYASPVKVISAPFTFSKKEKVCPDYSILVSLATSYSANCDSFLLLPAISKFYRGRI